MILRLMAKEIDKTPAVFLVCVKLLLSGRVQTFRFFSEFLKRHARWQNNMLLPFIVMMYPMAQVIDSSWEARVFFQDDRFYNACKVQSQFR